MISKLVKIFLLFFIISFLTFCKKLADDYLPKDGDGNSYDTVRIGTQTWFKENLKTTKYKNGVSIPLVTDNTMWSTYNAHAYCWYDNNPHYKDDYGALYNNKAVSSELLCPEGWHIPTSEEWSILIDYLDGEFFAGGKLKETGTTHWFSESAGTTNEYGFTALPGGYRYSDGTFKGLRKYGYFWMNDIDKFISVHYNNKMTDEGGFIGMTGYSVRCIKDR